MVTKCSLSGVIHYIVHCIRQQRNITCSHKVMSTHTARSLLRRSSRSSRCRQLTSSGSAASLLFDRSRVTTGFRLSISSTLISCFRHGQSDPSERGRDEMPVLKAARETKLLLRLLWRYFSMSVFNHGNKRRNAGCSPMRFT